MKRLLASIFIVCIFFSCMHPAYANTELTREEMIAANEVYYISDRQFFYYERDNQYIVMFSFKDENKTKRIACPCTVEFRLENSEGEVVYSATEHLTVDDFLTWTWSDPDYSHKNGLYGTIRIDPDEIAAKTFSSSGTMYISVYLDGWFNFSERAIEIDELPMLESTLELPSTPFRLTYNGYEGRRVLEIQNLDYTYRNGIYSLYITGEVLAGVPGKAEQYYLKWRMLDMEGYVVDSGSFLTDELFAGDKFKDKEFRIYNRPEGNYSFQLELSTVI